MRFKFETSKKLVSIAERNGIKCIKKFSEPRANNRRFFKFWYLVNRGNLATAVKEMEQLPNVESVTVGRTTLSCYTTTLSLRVHYKV